MNYNIKFKYNKPDIIKSLHFKVSVPYYNKVVKEVDIYPIVKEHWEKNFYEKDIFLNAYKTRKHNIIYNKVYDLDMGETFYDMVKYKHKFTSNIFLNKKYQNILRNYILSNITSMSYSKKSYEIASKEIQGTLINDFLQEFYFNKEKIYTSEFLKKNMLISWNMFYTQLESFIEPLNLNIINKNFYGNYIDNVNNSILNNYKASNKTWPKNTNILLKKNYVIQLIDVYKKEEQSIIDYLLYKIRKSELKIT